MTNTSEIIQGTPEWHAIRCGKVTASRVADVVARTKTGWGASRANYMAELIVERLTGVAAPAFVSDAMRWGTEKEPEARATYAFIHGVTVEQIGFVDHPEIAMAGASPDGLVGADGLVEIKCPITATHLETLLEGKIAAKYVTQMQWQMACTGRAWCDFISYDPRVPAHLQMFVQRVTRDDKMIADHAQMVRDFLKEVADKVAFLETKYSAQQAA